MSSPNEITSCEVCGNVMLEPVLDLGPHPLCDDLVPVGDDRICKEYRIEILYCSKCATAHQRFQVPKRDLFPKSYHYRSRFTADVLNGMSALVDSCEQRLSGMAGKVVLDVGCNDASLLDFFKRKGAKTIGIEPTDAYLDGLNKGHALYNGFFSPETAREIRAKHGGPDAITFTNVFAHIENLPEVLAALKELMTPRTMLVIENHYLGAVLDRCQFDTFYHEHPRTYSLSSFLEIAKSLGASLCGAEFPSRYGGNIRVFINGPVVEENARAVSDVLEKESRYRDQFLKLQANVERWKASMSARIKSLVAKYGKLSAKAFPGRAAILVKLLGIDRESIEAVYEKPGSMKIGHYLPGTRIPIKSDDELFSLASKPPVLINLAWHISAEIDGYLKQHGYQGSVVDILDPREFSARA
jgi:SAM-dependent methyltransferase